VQCAVSVRRYSGQHHSYLLEKRLVQMPILLRGYLGFGEGCQPDGLAIFFPVREDQALLKTAV
jgi:hypothetical protein